jgi:hypothetical protein
MILLSKPRRKQISKFSVTIIMVEVLGVVAVAAVVAVVVAVPIACAVVCPTMMI